MSTLVLTGLLIKSASESTFEVARNKLGASVNYTSDLSSVMQNMQGGRPEQGSTSTGRGFTLPDDYSAITTKEIEYIAQNSKYVKDYVISASLAGEPVDFSYYNPNKDNEESSTDTNGMGMMRISSASINITGVDIKSKDTTFNSDKNELIEGRYFTDEEVKGASNVVIIEQTIATLNDIKVGDTITITKQDRMQFRNNEDSDSEDVELTYEIIGIYKTQNPTDITNSDFRGSYNLTENTMYAPYTTILSSNLAGLSGDELETAKEQINTNGYEVQNVVFNLNNPTDIDAFIEEVKNMDEIDTTYRALGANDAAYEKMVGPIENVASTSSVLVIVVVIAGAFIIGLLSMLSIKDRKYELGVLLSLGESKVKIIGQLIFEMVIVSVLSFSLAALTSTLTAQGVTNYLLNQEITSSEEENTSNNNGFGNPMGGFYRVNRNELSNIDVDTIEELTVKVNSTDIVKMFGIGLFIIILGNVVQASFVFRCKPKEILLER